MTFAATLDFLLAHFKDEMVWNVIDEYHASYGGEDVLNGPMTYAQAVVHKQATERRQPGRKARIVFDYNEVTG